MLSLWQMSLSASAVILLTALLRRLAGSRLPRRMYVAMWDVALLASLVPFRVPFATLSRLLPQQTAKPAGDFIAGLSSAAANAVTQPPTMPLVQGTAPVVEAIPAAAQKLPAVLPSTDLWQNGLDRAVRSAHTAIQSIPGWVWQTGGILWLAGMAVLAVMLLRRWFMCLHAFSEALPCGDGRVAAFLQDHRLLRPIQVRLSSRIASPLSYGLWRPIILLPSALIRADDRTMAYVLTHEFLHIHAWDMLRKWALLLALCLHWPNPLLWLMLRLYNRDMELMCDERVLRRLGGRKAYCLTLLDMEARRSNLTMGTCFSVTGIEERIQVMKNRKHQGILSIALACAIFLGAAAGAMTGIPLAGAENASPRIFFSRQTWDASYAQYEPYGLAYDAANGTITYNGQVVRYFEDMWPIDEQGKAGTCFMYKDGTVDVYGVREFPEFIQRNPDGSFDPSGTLVGLREATPEEYDEQTARQEAAHLTPGMVTEYAFADAYQFTDAAVLNTGSEQQAFGLVPDAIVVSVDDLHAATVDKLDVEWWTAEEYREWLEDERVALQQLVEEEARAWTPSTGWFTWTQEKVDEAIARYESILEAIEAGAAVSRTINGEEGNMTLMQDLSDYSFSFATEAAEGASTDMLSIDSQSDDGIVLSTPIYGVFSSQNSSVILTADDGAVENDAETSSILVSVTSGDDKHGTTEAQTTLKDMTDQGAIVWHVPAGSQQEEIILTASQLARIEAWRETLAPYAPFGLSYALDTTNDLVRLYWNGQEIRGIFDPQRGTWITEHAGTGYYPVGAKELIAVYENVNLTGLREADAEESAVWDKLREENTNNR